MRTQLGQGDAAPLTVEDRQYVHGGFARSSYVHSPLWRSLFQEMERFSNDFAARAWGEGSMGYSWPLDPLHWWSRTWEYPWVDWHVRHNHGRSGARVLDVGTAVTFFPFHLLRQGFELTCLDSDASMPDHFRRVSARVMPDLWSGPLPKYIVADARATGLGADSFDMITCVSVLEHIPRWLDALKEMQRLVAAGGLLILTLDIRRNATSNGLSEDELAQMHCQLEADFELLTAQETQPPPDAIETLHPPLPTPPPPADPSRRPPSLPRRLARFARSSMHRLRNWWEGRPPENISIYGGVWKKKG